MYNMVITFTFRNLNFLNTCLHVLNILITYDLLLALLVFDYLVKHEICYDHSRTANMKLLWQTWVYAFNKLR